MSDFRKELEALLNSHNRENGSSTPDFVLASYLQKSLDALDTTVKERESWYGRLAMKVAARFVQADQPAGARKGIRDMLTPINKPKGISRETVKEHVVTEKERDSEGKADRRDIRPEDAFTPKPKNMNVLDYVRKGWPGDSEDYQDMEKAIRNQIPKDKGFGTVKNLSQYLIETGGGGGTKPVGK